MSTVLWIDGKSNVSPFIFKNLLLSQFVRYGRLISYEQEFVGRSHTLFEFYSKDHKIPHLGKLVHKFAFNNAVLLSKFVHPSRTSLNTFA